MVEEEWEHFWCEPSLFFLPSTRGGLWRRWCGRRGDEEIRMNRVNPMRRGHLLSREWKFGGECVKTVLSEETCSIVELEFAIMHESVITKGRNLINGFRSDANLRSILHLNMTASVLEWTWSRPSRTASFPSSAAETKGAFRHTVSPSRFVALCWSRSLAVMSL